MAAGSVIVYSRIKDDLRFNDLTGATIKLALVTSAYTPNSGTGGNYLWADVSANEITAANGYTAGGYTVTSPTVTAITNGWKFSTGNATWTATGGSISAWRYGVLYVSGTLWTLTNPLLGYFLGDTTPADVPATTTGNTLTINCPADGWFDIV